MRKIRCKISYHQLKGAKLNTFAVGVDNGIYDHNPPFLTPTMTQLTFQGLISAFVTKNAEYEGHTATEAEMEEKRAELMTGLDIQSSYVDSVASGDAIIIELGGFLATKGTTSEKIKPTQPVGTELNRGISRQLISDCAVVAGAESYGALLVANNPLPAGIVISDGGQIIYENNETPPGPGPEPVAAPGSLVFIIDLTKKRRKIFNNLQVGTTYWVYYWAMNSAGVSVLSDGVSMNVIE